MMKLQMLLFSVLIHLSVSAPMGDDCDALTKPLSLEDHSVLAGSAYLAYAYSDNNITNKFLSMTQSSAFNITVNDGNVTFHEEYKINGSCIGMTIELHIKDDTAIMNAYNMTSIIHLLPTCEGCYVLYGNSSTKNVDEVLKMMNLDFGHVDDMVNARALYFFGSESGGVKDEDVQRFKKQARCLGFHQEPDFIYNADNTYCKEGEGVQI